MSKRDLLHGQRDLPALRVHILFQVCRGHFGAEPQTPQRGYGCRARLQRRAREAARGEESAATAISSIAQVRGTGQGGVKVLGWHELERLYPI